MTTNIPIELFIYIRLVTKNPLNKAELRQFYKTVKKFGPENIVSHKNLIGPDGHPTKVRFFHKRTQKGNHRYEIPLTRSLTSREIEKIKEVWDTFYAEPYKIEYSAIENYTSDENPLPAEPDDYKNFCEKIAKHQHMVWMNGLVSDGWRYGLRFSERHRTHPLLKPWHSLPEKYREIDDSLPGLFLGLLKNEGFNVVKKKDKKISVKIQPILETKDVYKEELGPYGGKLKYKNGKPYSFINAEGNEFPAVRTHHSFIFLQTWPFSYERSFLEKIAAEHHTPNTKGGIDRILKRFWLVLSPRDEIHSSSGINFWQKLNKK